jgi:hypothetical protein
MVFVLGPWKLNGQLEYCRRSAQPSLKCRSLMHLLGITQKLAYQVKPGSISVFLY